MPLVSSIHPEPWFLFWKWNFLVFSYFMLYFSNLCGDDPTPSLDNVVELLYNLGGFVEPIIWFSENFGGLQSLVVFPSIWGGFSRKILGIWSSYYCCQFEIFACGFCRVAYCWWFTLSFHRLLCFRLANWCVSSPIIHHIEGFFISSLNWGLLLPTLDSHI